MADILERLRNKKYLRGDLTIEAIDAERAEAADEIERLRAESVDKATAWDKNAEKNAEIERLRAALCSARCYVTLAKDDMRLSPVGRETAAGRLVEIDTAMGPPKAFVEAKAERDAGWPREFEC